MAVVLAFRLAIAFATSPAGGVTLRWVAAGGATYAGAYEHGILSAWNRLHDPSQDPADLGAEMSAGYPESGAAFSVTDFTGTFELRKLQWRLSRAPSGAVEDVDVCTFHFIKATGGTPGTYVDGTDLPAVETALGTFWGSIKTNFSPSMHSDQFRWYKDGPAFYVLNTAGTAYVPIGDNAAIRVTEVDVAGTTGSASLPPQCALTITEKVTSRKHWGRFYLPAPSVDATDANGHITSAKVTSFLAAAVTFYNSCRSASMVPVVWSIQKPARTNARGGALAAQDGMALEVSSLQMDDIVDIIRRRRWQQHASATQVTTLT